MHGRGVTQGTSCPTKQGASPSDGLDSTGCVLRWLGGSQETHERRKLFSGTDRISYYDSLSIGHIVRRFGELAVRSFIPLGLEQFVGNTHFNVIRFTGEQEKRLVLSLPSETGNRAIIAVFIRLAGDRAAGEHNIRPAENSQCALLRCISGLVREKYAVWNLFDQPRAKYRSGNPEDDIVVRSRCSQLGYLDA